VGTPNLCCYGAKEEIEKIKEPGMVLVELEKT
jgi:hypothetical protein